MRHRSWNFPTLLSNRINCSWLQRFGYTFTFFSALFPQATSIKDYTLKSNILKPILKTDLLAPISYNASIMENINNCEYILSRIPDSNFVKQFLLSELLENKVDIIADKGINSEKINNIISNIQNTVEDDINYNEKGEKVS